MKLRNKKTGEIVDVRMSYREDTAPIVVSETTCDENGQSQGWPYNSLSELNEEWEDYEEPKGIKSVGTIGSSVHIELKTKEEAEKAVEKLKAWKRLKDFGCDLMLDDHFKVKFVGPDARKITTAEEQKSLSDAYKLVFGGEE